MNTVIRKYVAILLLTLTALTSIAVQAKQVGEIQYARGAITVQQSDGSGARLIGKGDKLNTGEVIKTGPKSFLILRLDDDTRMTLRPETTFAVEEYAAERNNKAKALLRLFRGGMRTITGFISKMNSSAYRIKTPTATIGIRGTEFDARLCAEDCAAENSKLDSKIQADAQRTIAKIVFMRGEVKANDFLDRSRTLSRLSSVYEGDTITTDSDSYAILVFRDKSRVSLQENTQFRVDELRYEFNTEETGVSALFSLLRGGLRTVTGLIGKSYPDKYRMRTAIATIGIRGTGYDMLCTGPCANDNSTAATPMPKGDGLYTYVWEGGVTVGEQPVLLDQSAFINNKFASVEILPSVPAHFIDNPMPKPDTMDVDESKLFTAKSGETVPPGLYLSVSQGEVTLHSDVTKASVKIKKGQAVFADVDGKLVQQLPAIPTFQQYDAYPTPDKLTPTGLETDSGILGDIENKDMVCEIK